MNRPEVAAFDFHNGYYWLFKRTMSWVESTLIRVDETDKASTIEMGGMMIWTLDPFVQLKQAFNDGPWNKMLTLSDAEEVDYDATLDMLLSKGYDGKTYFDVLRKAIPNFQEVLNKQEDIVRK